MLLSILVSEYAFNKTTPADNTKVEIPELVEFPPTDFCHRKRKKSPKKVFKKQLSLDEIYSG